MTAARGFIWKMSAHAVRRIERLTPREREVFECLVVGRSNKAIGDKLSISPRTVELHRAHVMKKMQAQSLPHLVRMALEIDKRADQNKKMATEAAQRIEGLTPREKEVFEDLVVIRAG